MGVRTGSRLGAYEILAPLGAGGMGEVYRARDYKLGRDVALKTLPDAFIHDPERLSRFRREAHVLATLNHQNIAQIHGLEEADGTQFLVLEFVDGESLDKRIARGPLPVDEALAIAKQITEALEAAHEKGIIHRDLKPANIALTAAHQVKVLDFGLAKATESAVGASVGLTNSPTITSPAVTTGAGVLLGTAAYMAPEQAKGRAADRRSDMWAFGCVLYEMLSARRAFEGEDVSETIAFILTREPDWRALPPTTPEAIRRLLRRALQKDRTRRLESAADAHLEVDDALTSVTDSAKTSTGFPDRRQFAAVAAILIVGALAGALTSATIMSRFRLPQADTRVLRLQIEPPSGGEFVLGGNGPTVGTIALSPSGNAIAYLARVNGKQGLWVRPLDATAARLLPGTEGAAFPMWAPDGGALAFFARGKLQRIDLSGDKSVTIADNLGLTIGGGTVRDGAWGHDGSILFPSMFSSVLRVSATGGTPAPLMWLDAAHGEASVQNPQFLPAGRILFTVTGSTPETTGTYAAPLTNPAARIKVSEHSNALYASSPDGMAYLCWQRNGTLMAQPFDASALNVTGEPRVLASESDDARLLASISSSGVLAYGVTRGLTQYHWFDRAGKMLTEVGQPGRTFMFRLSPDERQLILQPLRDPNLWLIDASRGLISRFTSGSGGQRTHPIWSPDGHTIAFGRVAGTTIYRKAVSGASDDEPILQRPQFALPTDWSADGRWIIDYETDPQTKFDLWILPVMPDGRLRNDDKPRPYLRTPFAERFGRFSPGPSPRWVAFQSDESGQNEIYVAAFPEPRGKVRISTAGGMFPQWRGDARELFYLSPDFKLMAVSLKETADSIEPSPPRELFTITAPGTYMSPFEVSRDGQRFLVLATEETPQSLRVIVNWPALLKNGAGAP